MCGIFGYLGKKTNAGEIVFEGLKSLEYRGYDSWGIVTKIKDQKSRQRRGSSKTAKIKNELKIEKHVGKISEASFNQSIFNLKSNLALSHSRWATHGNVTVENAHPHLDCLGEIAVVHNGIVENYAQLKEDLIKKGHKFLSETDTEVIPHLIEEFMKKRERLLPPMSHRSRNDSYETFASAVKDAFNLLKGLNAIVVLRSKSGEIIAAKTGSPLIVGEKNNEYFIASDATGIIKHTKKLLFLKDKEMVILGDKLQLISLPKGRKITPKFETVDWKIEDVDKGKYKHFMIKEINEQPKVIRNIAENYTDQIESLTRVIKIARGTFFIGAGTAYHAGMGGTYLFSTIADHHVNTAVASEFNYLENFLNKDSLVIALSQSGETIDVVEPLNRAKDRGSKIAAITNSLGSTIYRIADYKLLLGAGPEKAVASTKAYTAKLSILLLLAFALKGKIKEGERLITQAANEIERILDKKNISAIKKLADKLQNVEHIYTLGRGLSYSTTLEAALKIKEVSYIHTEGLAGGELKHGTIALISKGTPCIVFAPKDETYEAIISNAIEIKSRGGVIIGISPEKAKVFDYFLKVEDLGQAALIGQIIPAQLLAYFLALKKGYDPDKPRNLAKSVTVK